MTKETLSDKILKEFETADEFISVEDLKQFMKKWAEEGKLPHYGVPDRYEFIDHIPKTSVGKLDKKELRKMYSE